MASRRSAIFTMACAHAAKAMKYQRLTTLDVTLATRLTAMKASAQPRKPAPTPCSNVPFFVRFMARQPSVTSETSTAT